MKYILVLIFIFTAIIASEDVPTESEVCKLYVATFNRAPDSAGLNYWVNNSGLKLSQIAQSFFDQTETQLLYPSSTTNREFVQSVYLNLFNREPDTGGWDYWENELNLDRFTKNRFIEAVINGALNTETSLDLDILNNKLEVGLYFSNRGLEDEVIAKSVLTNITSDVATITSAQSTIDQLLNLSPTLAPVVTTGEIATTNFLISGGEPGIDYMQGFKDENKLYYIDEVLVSPNEVFSFDLEIPNDTLYGEVAGTTMPYVGMFIFPTTDDNTNENVMLGDSELNHMQSVQDPFKLKEDNKKYPLVIYSHGKGDYPLGSNMMTLYKRLAQNGYIVLSIAHGDFRFKSLYDMDLNNFQEMTLRPLSVKTAIDTLQNSEYFQSIIDFEKIAAMGSSLGGGNMWMLAGANIIGPSIFSTREVVSDDRIKAFVGIVPLSGVEYPVFGLGAVGIKNISKPFLVFSASADTLVPASSVETAMSSLADKSNKKLILLDNEPHVISSDALEIVSQWAIPFLKANLDSDIVSKAKYDYASSSSFNNDSVVDIQ